MRCVVVAKVVPSHRSLGPSYHRVRRLKWNGLLPGIHSFSWISEASEKIANPIRRLRGHCLGVRSSPSFSIGLRQSDRVSPIDENRCGWARGDASTGNACWRCGVPYVHCDREPSFGDHRSATTRLRERCSLSTRRVGSHQACRCGSVR